MNRSIRFAAAMMAAGMVTTFASGQLVSALASTQPTTQATTRPWGDRRSFTLTPRAPAADALHDRLRVDPADQIDGNAGPLYLQAILMLPTDEQFDQYWKVADAVGEGTDADAEFGRRVAAEVPWLDTAMPQLLELATRCDRCDWGVPLRRENYRALLPFLNPLRQLANLLNAKARLALVRNDLPQALKLLQAESTLATHVDEGTNVLVQNLVGVGIQGLCSEMIEHYMQRPDAPNLYWALRQYPLPVGNLRVAIETERMMQLDAFPALRKARDGDAITGEDWTLFVAQLRAMADSIAKGRAPTPLAVGRNQDVTFSDELTAGMTAIASSADARDYYARTRHLTLEQVGKIDALKVAATYQLETYHQQCDALYKWFGLPYPQMLPGLKAAQAELDRQIATTPGMSIMRTIAPSFGRAALTNARNDRIIAAFACVEAIRAYAAAHDGTLPPTLDAITETPTPLNPVSGKPFGYTVNADGTATIGDGGDLCEWPMRYDLRLRN